MVDERAAGIILFRERHGDRQYLLIKNRGGGHWGFPKGHIEPGEDEATAALREVREEVGIHHVELIPGFVERDRYTFLRRGRPVNKELVLFLAYSPEDGAPSLPEIEAMEWVPFPQALERLTYPEQREVLRKAEDFLNRRAKGV